AEQAEHFLACAHAAGLRPGDLIALDAEDGGLDGLQPARMNVAALEFAEQLRKHWPSYWPVVYTEISMAQWLTVMGECPLWLADLSQPLVQAIGPWELVSFWQTGQRGVDVDLFNGDLGQLRKLAIPG